MEPKYGSDNLFLDYHMWFENEESTDTKGKK